MMFSLGKNVTFRYVVSFPDTDNKHSTTLFYTIVIHYLFYFYIEKEDALASHVVAGKLAVWRNRLHVLPDSEPQIPQVLGHVHL